MRESSRAVNKKDNWREDLSETAMDKMKDLLKHELDVYNLARALFHKKHRFFKSGNFRKNLMQNSFFAKNKILSSLV